MILRGQDLPQQLERRQIHHTALELVENDREPARQPRRRDAQIGLVFREMQDFGAVREERRTARTEIQLPGPEFRQMRDEARCSLTLAPRKLDYLRDELLIGKSSDGETVSFHVLNIRGGSPISARYDSDMKR